MHMMLSRKEILGGECSLMARARQPRFPVNSHPLLLLCLSSTSCSNFHWESKTTGFATKSKIDAMYTQRATAQPYSYHCPYQRSTSQDVLLPATVYIGAAFPRPVPICTGDVANSQALELLVQETLSNPSQNAQHLRRLMHRNILILHKHNYIADVEINPDIQTIYELSCSRKRDTDFVTPGWFVLARFVHLLLTYCERQTLYIATSTASIQFLFFVICIELCKPFSSVLEV